jgi:opacity protein-like surface antigen
VSLAALGMTPAIAADLAPRAYSKAPVPAPVVTWGGFYVGVEAGAASTRDGWSAASTAFSGVDGATFGSADGSGAFGGGVIGYNWQLPNNVVLGIEGNFDAANIEGTTPCNETAGTLCHSRLDSLYSATGRLGYAASGPLGPMLFFAKAGVAWTNQKLSLTNVGIDTLSGSSTRTGWTVGTGAEYMFAPNWSVKVEYDYYDFGNKTATLSGQVGDDVNSFDINSKLTVNTVKAGVNYHFGDPLAPAVAADLATRTYTKAPGLAPVVSWGGFYVGVEAGAGSTRDTWSQFGATLGSADGSSAFGGGVIGYNWQLPSNVVLGIEGNFDAADIKGTAICAVSATATCESKLDSLYSATGRLGYAASGPLGPMLFFAKAGVAWTDQKLNFTANLVDVGLDTLSGSTTRTGWTLGTGAEYMFAPNWSAKVEYDYYDFGNKTTTLTDTTGSVSIDNSSKLTVNTVKAGINYHFGDPSGPKF